MPKVSSNYILKSDKPELHRQIDAWLQQQSANVESLRPDFRKWFDQHVAELREMIDQPKAYYWQVNSFTRHIVSSVKRMQSGEIVSLTETGGFNIAAR